ncbi:hypothetical protein C7C56_020970 [Massilia glaciei]|uniref:Uncharacterized protein n=2 Tax=Massilia glaciei TaxID=1524097 RepID=A0A2U2HFW5_9BURK|nr:hypothetical protein C7C56_020970 [Massilia glaciei]
MHKYVHKYGGHRQLALVLAGCLGWPLLPAPAVAAPTAQPSRAAKASEADVDLVRHRLAESFVESGDGASEIAVDTLLETLDKDGHWPDPRATPGWAATSISCVSGSWRPPRRPAATRPGRASCKPLPCAPSIIGSTGRTRPRFPDSI